MINEKSFLHKYERVFQDFWKILKDNQFQEATTYYNTITEYRDKSEQNYTQSYYSILILSVIYFLIDTEEISELSFLGISLSNLGIIRWAILVATSFFIYRGLYNFIFESIYNSLRTAYLDRFFPAAVTSKAIGFMMRPSIINFERFTFYMTNTKFLSYTFFFILIIIFLILPYVIYGYMLYKNIRVFGATDFFSITAMSISIFLIFRITVFMIQWFIGTSQKSRFGKSVYNDIKKSKHI